MCKIISLLKVTKCEQDESSWTEETTNNRKKFKWLSFLTNYSVKEVYKLIKCGKSGQSHEFAQSIFWKLLFLLPKSIHGQRSVIHHFVRLSIL